VNARAAVVHPGLRRGDGAHPGFACDADVHGPARDADRQVESQLQVVSDGGEVDVVADDDAVGPRRRQREDPRREHAGAGPLHQRRVDTPPRGLRVGPRRFRAGHDARLLRRSPDAGAGGREVRGAAREEDVPDGCRRRRCAVSCAAPCDLHALPEREVPRRRPVGQPQLERPLQRAVAVVPEEAVEDDSGARTVDADGRLERLLRERLGVADAQPGRVRREPRALPRRDGSWCGDRRPQRIAMRVHDAPGRWETVAGDPRLLLGGGELARRVQVDVLAREVRHCDREVADVVDADDHLVRIGGIVVRLHRRRAVPRAGRGRDDDGEEDETPAHWGPRHGTSRAA
jgi:hypothetical protein